MAAETGAEAADVEEEVVVTAVAARVVWRISREKIVLV